MTRLLDIKEYFPELIDRLKFVIKLPKAKSINLHTNGCCRFSSLNELMKLDDQYVIGNGMYFQSHLYSSHLRDLFLEWTKPTTMAMDEKKKSFPPEKIKGKVLCVHARRGDFRYARRPMASQANFTRYATKFILEKYLLNQSSNQSTVILFSNDLRWMNKTFSDVFIGAESGDVNYLMATNVTPLSTIIISRQYCDNLIITAPASTFAWFMGFMAKEGKARVFYSEPFAKSSGNLVPDFRPSEFHLPHWIPLRIHSNLTLQEISVNEIEPYPKKNGIAFDGD
ncbi:unnamed protein product, partial [Mesorhabditis belari]|uniref:L-Fucosyltransferase n=1 Tax=Mesorhabditis belari TaxID=2138241 RepID=A0AAF3F6H4_9BILA